MQDFNDKVAVITGGASGIGLGMARAFAARGAHLVLGDLDATALDQALAEFSQAGVQAHGQLCDVSSLESVESLADFTMATHGAVHVVCNNAGVGIPTSARNLKLEDWKWIIDVDLWGPIYGVKTFLPLLEAQGEGHINATASMAGLISSGMMGAYNAAKHGVVALMAVLERELRAADSPIRASVLCPGPINTNISFNSVAQRPGQAKPKTDGGKEGKVASDIQAMLEQGMHPNDVGELVAESIAAEKFWILTHPHYAKAVRKQLDALMEDQTLTRA